MDTSTIQRYQPGGDIYAKLVSQYGATQANAIAQAALTGDRTQITTAIASADYGAPLNTSTFDAFVTQLETDPLGAPMESLNNQLTSVIKDLFKNPMVLLTLGLVLFFTLFNGVAILRNIGKKS